MDERDFGEDYFRHGCGRPYQRDEHWVAFFARIADVIVARIRPRRVLDAGCAMGLLVEALRERGVEAYGFDLSSYALARVPTAIRPYCWQASVADEIRGAYDLIVCQEVLPHLAVGEAERAVANFCRHSDDVLFSVSPYGPAPRHANTEPPEHWARVFAEHGFHPDVGFDASTMTRWAVRYRRRPGAVEQAAGLANCRSLDEFYEITASLGVHQSERFMHLELDLINRCNLRCVMCFHSLEGTRRVPTAHMTPEAFSAIAARLLPHCYHLSLSLGNEPLMSPHFVEILRVVAKYDVPHVNFFTNGLLLTDEKIDAILACGVTQVCVSVDGATAATYNAIRRDGDFDRVMANVTRLIERRQRGGHALPVVRFDMVLMQRNIHEAVELVRLAASLGVQQLNFAHLVSFEGLDMDRESLIHTRALANYWLDRALAEAATLGLDVPYHPAPFTLDDRASPVPTAANAPFLPTPYCPFPFFHVSVGPGGHVLPCPYSHAEDPYGRVSDETPIDRIWLGPKFTALRQRILSHDPPDMCRRCSFLSNRHPNVDALFVTRHN